MNPPDSLLPQSWRDDPRVGDVIRERNTPRLRAVAARVIIDVEPERVQTSGMSGRQRDRWMSRARLARYYLVERRSA